MDIPASDECMSALRGHGHLAMKDVPNEKTMDHLSKWHGGHAQQLSEMCSQIPGGEGCPPNEVMSRAIQHLNTLNGVPSRLGITHMSAGPEGKTQLMSRIDTLATASEQLAEKDAQIRSRDSQIQMLSAKVVKDLDPDAESIVVDSLSGQFDQLAQCGIAPHVIVGLKRAFLHDGTRGNTIMLSKLPAFGGKAGIVTLLELLRTNAGYEAPKGGAQTPTQLASVLRPIPGETGPSAEELEAGGAALQRAMGIEPKASARA